MNILQSQSESNLYKVRFTFFLLSIVCTIWFSIYADFWLFFTNWSWMLNAFYFLLILISHGEQTRVVEYFIRILFSVSLSCTLIVSIIFWTLLSSNIQSVQTTDEKIALVIQHLLNILVMLTESILCKISVKWYDFIFVSGFLLLYAIVIILLHFTISIEWPYPFLEFIDHPNIGILTVALIGIILLGAFGFLVLRGVLYLKDFRKWTYQEILDEQ